MQNWIKLKSISDTCKVEVGTIIEKVSGKVAKTTYTSPWHKNAQIPCLSEVHKIEFKYVKDAKVIKVPSEVVGINRANGTILIE